MSLDFALEPHTPTDRRIAAKTRKTTGAHYTPSHLAAFVAGKIVEALPAPAGVVRIVDPAVGDGELLTALFSALASAGIESIEITAFDTNREALAITRDRLSAIGVMDEPTLRTDDFVSFAADYQNEGALFPLPKFDVVIANPPYVRTQVLGSETAQNFAGLFNLSGRVDLYHVFLCGISTILRPGGIAGVIVSNRFMTTRGGAEIRRRLAHDFDILHVWDLGDTKVFEAAVLPAVLLLRKKTELSARTTSKFTSIYLNNSMDPAADGASAIRHLEQAQDPNGESSDYIVVDGDLFVDQKAGGIWRVQNDTTTRWLETVADHTCYTFEEVGKIRVGVKTTADKIFIHSNWINLPESERPEILRPLITHHIGRPYRSLPIQTQILYPHEVREGRRAAINLDGYPIARKYLEGHRAALESREYVISSGRKWYEIWVPQDPELWKRPKVVFRDISVKPMFWIDLSGAIVNGDCYWLTNDYLKDDNILWLVLAVANSSFIETFYDMRFNNKLYSGRRRFMTQYVEKFPVPNPFSKIPQQIIGKVKELVSVEASEDQTQLEREIDCLVWKSFGVTKEVTR